MTAQEKAEELDKLREQLGDLLPVRIVAEENCSAVCEELEKVDEELTNLYAKKAELASSLQIHEKFLAERVAEWTSIEEKVIAVKKTPVISDCAASTLQWTRCLLDDERMKIGRTKWEPKIQSPSTMHIEILNLNFIIARSH